ncbi:hypothetical protein GJAV_G00046610 [Gymnothorax javanicus]|nr:hypothetical protein GJAV_G00046610 [Gymnothorax javanicus]
MLRGEGEGRYGGNSKQQRNSQLSTYKADASSLLLTFSLLICGDVHPCPGPVVKRAPKYPCVTCQKAVRSNSKAVSCDNCEEWTHIKCGEISLATYNSAVERGEDLPFVCSRCLLSGVPGSEVVDGGEDGGQLIDTPSQEDPTPNNSQADDSQWQCFRKRGLHFLHLNARSLLPKIEEFRLVARRSNAAVIGVTETWLDNSVEDSEVEIPGYIIHRKDRQRTGGGVCIYIRSDIAFNPRSDLELEEFWAYKALLMELTRRLTYCVQPELIPLMEVTGVLEVCSLPISHHCASVHRNN